MKKKNILILLSTFASLSIFSSCGGNETPSSSFISSENISSETLSSSDNISSSEIISSSSSEEIEDVVIDNRIYTNLPFIKMDENCNILMSVSCSDVLKVNFKIDNNEENATLIFDSSNYELKLNDDKVFSFNEINPSQITSSIELTIGNETLNTSIKDYFEKLANCEKEDFDSFIFEHYALQEVAISYLNYVSELHDNQNGIELNDAQKSVLYSSNAENIYHSDWTKRDNLTVVSGSETEDFKWDLPVLCNFENPTLRYTFAVTKDLFDNLSVDVKIKDKVFETDIYKLDDSLQLIDGKDIYGFDIKGISPLNYSDVITTSIKNNGELIGTVVEYSFTRGLARLDIIGNDKEKTLSNALYSLAKSLTWYHNGEAAYDYLPPIGDNGIYTWERGEYSYGGKEKHIVTNSYSYFGHYVYSTGGLVDADGDSLVYEGNGFKLEYISENNYRATLTGGTLDGILLNNGASLEIVVEKDTTINGTLYRNWDDKNSKTSGSIISSSGNVVIKGQGKLSINGQLYIDGNLTIEEGVSVDINTTKSYTSGITCNGDLLIDNASLNIISKGNAINLNGSVDENNESQQTFTVNGENSIVKLIGTGYGVTSNTTNRTLIFNDGNIEIVGNTGLNWSNLIIDKAEVKIIAKNGYTIESSSDVEISTISGNYNVGSLTLINETPYNMWWDVNYVVKPKVMNINGGTLTFEGSCRTGIIQTTKDSSFVFENCDIYIKSYQSGHGIGADEGGSIIVENTSRVFTYNCDIPIGCWNKDNPVEVTIRGDFVGVNCQGQVGTWDDSTRILEGFIRYVNE